MAKKKCSFGKFLLVGIVAAAAAGIVAVWKASNPVEDPWKLPTPNSSPQEPTGQAQPASTDQVGPEPAGDSTTEN